MRWCLALCVILAGCAPRMPAIDPSTIPPEARAAAQEQLRWVRSPEWAVHARQQAAADAEADAYCNFVGTAAGASGGFAASVVGEARTRAACLNYYRQTGRVPGRP